MKRSISKALAIVMALALALSVAAVSAFAVDYTAIPGTSTTFNKNLVVDSTAQIPNVEFEFEIAAGTAVPASSTNLEILAGPVTASAPTVENAVFTSGMTTTNGTPTDDTETSKKFATDEVIVDFSGVEFDKPGVYRYVITEKASTIKGVTNDANATRYLDVFVVADESNALSVQSYALRDTATNISLATGKYAENEDVKSSGYTNELSTVDLEFAKKITGNQGDKNKQFKFTLAITDANPGLYTVEVSRADVLKDDSNVAANEGVYTITVAADGTCTAYFYLADGDTVKVLDLPEGYGYTLTEVPEDYQSAAGVDNDGTDNDYTDATSGSAVDVDVKTGYTNDRNGIIPTGVIVTVAPFAIGLLVFGAIILYVVSKRRRAEY